MANTNYTQFEDKFVKTANSLVEQSRNGQILTHFLNPREQEIIENFARNANIEVKFFGGYLGSERRRAIINPESDDFQIATIQIEYPDKFFTIYHSTIIGSLIHNGIRFEAIGDVIHEGNIWQFFIEENLSEFVQREIHNVGKKSVKFIAAQKTITSDDDFIVQTLTVNSLRLDLVISDVFNINRAESKSMIENLDVRLNYFDFNNPSYTLSMFDVVSVHGHGRFQFMGTLATTKKNKFKIEIKKISR
ncbi:MAG: hypothetical protein LBM27_00660 [Lactobacillaceae bacterium]|jgi:RNA-binding protein YlmH|nr:hypothetical protein [Lactobacillaceae bacterium]